MSCCHCQALDDTFDNKTARKELKHYRRKGPSKTTRMLIEALSREGLEGESLLDIGGGVGAIQHELLQAGASRALNVDASAAYIAAAREEAQRQGLADRVSYRHGNFVDIAAEIEPVDIVTLDRVVCCYPDMPALVGLSSARADKLYALVFPREAWWTKIAFPLLNAGLWLIRNPFRIFLHPTEAIDRVIEHNGLKRRFYRQTFLWQVAVYGR